MSDEHIQELSWETGRDLELSPPQLVQNKTAWGGIHQLDQDVSEYQQDLFHNHFHSMSSLAPVMDPFLSAPTPPVADLLISASPQHTEYLQPCGLNMARNEFMMPIDKNKQLPPKTKGISQPGSVASTSKAGDQKRKGKTGDQKRKGKEVHVEGQNAKEADYTGKGKRGRASSSPKKMKHNLSEMVRREKINKQLNNLHTIVHPYIYKDDQVSILDGAIAQIKLLQEQIQQKLSMKPPFNANASAASSTE